MAIYNTILSLLALIGEPEVLWNIIPLAFATLLIVIYFIRYNEENPGWNTYLTNSLVLIFVSMSLLRYIYNIDGAGAVNFIYYQAKSLATVFLLLIGSILLKFNFEHILPERFARHISSPLTINLSAFAIILFVYSELESNFEMFFSLVIIVIVLSIIFNLLKFPTKKLFKYIEKEKKKEKIKNVKEEKYQIDELKRQLRAKEKELKSIRKGAEDEKKEALKLKRIIRK